MKATRRWLKTRHRRKLERAIRDQLAAMKTLRFAIAYSAGFDQAAVDQLTELIDQCRRDLEEVSGL